MPPAMRVSDLPYHIYLDTPWINRQTVRVFDGWQVLSAGSDGYFLLVDQPADECALLIQYETCAERERDIEVIRRLPASGDNGNADAPFPAWLRPVPPTRTARDAKPLPQQDEPC